MIDPTRGVDVGAHREVKAIWSELTARGHSLLIASTDVEELVDVCNRVVVMNSGKTVGELSGAELTERNLVRMASDG
jgi:ABC-type sugar transport system ATPase subunit